MFPGRSFRTMPHSAGLLLCAVPALWLAALWFAPGGKTIAASSPASAAILKPADLANLMPATVFFRGQSATVQERNSGGVKFSDGMFVLCALVDTSGYSSTVQQKYQAYLITEVAINIDGQRLEPGAYGVGFVEGDRFLVMDVGGHDHLSAGSTHDGDLKRPTPLQVLADTSPEKYRLYINRNYIVFSRAPGA